MAIEYDKQGGTEDEQLCMVDKLDIEDCNLGDELADAPNCQLDEPGFEIDVIVEVDVLIIDGDLFIDVDAAFEDLEKIARDK